MSAMYHLEKTGTDPRTDSEQVVLCSQDQVITIRELARAITALNERDAYIAKLEARNKVLREEKRIDDRTGLKNDRFIRETLKRELVKRTQKQGKPFAALLFDLDKFKARVNDEHGHLAGNRVLKDLSKKLKSIFKRKTDYVIRYGGEELLVIIDGSKNVKAESMTVEEAAQLAENARGIIEASPCDLRRVKTPTGIKSLGVTVSVGVAVFSLDPDSPSETLDDVIGCADLALYRAKGKLPDGKGDDPNETDARNRVCYIDAAGQIHTLARKPMKKPAVHLGRPLVA